jgi:hypothetical protein
LQLQLLGRGFLINRLHLRPSLTSIGVISPPLDEGRTRKERLWLNTKPAALND